MTSCREAFEQGQSMRNRVGRELWCWMRHGVLGDELHEQVHRVQGQSWNTRGFVRSGGLDEEGWGRSCNVREVWEQGRRERGGW